MKRLSKSLFLFFALLVLTMIPVQSTMAASARPGNVSKLTAKAASDTSVKLTWSKASKATGYRVYVVDTATNKLKKVATTTKNTCEIKKIKIDQTYVFQVYAYRKSGSKTYLSAKGSPMATVRTKLSTPGKPSKFRFICSGNNSVFLAWNEAKNADKYIIYQYDETTGEYNPVLTTSETSCQIKKLVAGQKYYFKIQSYHALQGKEAYGAISDKISATPKTVNVSAIHGRYWNATVKKKVSVKTSTGATLTLKKGTSIIATKNSTSTLTAKLKNGTTFTIKGSNLKYGNLYVTKSYYSKDQKEAFVNGRGYSSPTGYLVWINQYTCNTSIFKGSKGAWKLVRSMPCVIGAYGRSTQGVLKLCKRTSAHNKPKIYYTWNKKKQYGNSFHCRIDKNTRAAVSGGCIRLGDSDLYYLANHCPLGTTVVSY